jgi:uncharacterized repeat protein (TIGR04138 family)
MYDKDQVIQQIVARDARYRADAYEFVFEALDYTLQRRGGAKKHVSGPEIMESVRLLALERFGFLARGVLAHWGVFRTDDFGEMVFNLIDADLLQKTADDRKQDFAGLYDFAEAFDTAFRASLQSVEI